MDADAYEAHYGRFFILRRHNFPREFREIIEILWIVTIRRFVVALVSRKNRRCRDVHESSFGGLRHIADPRSTERIYAPAVLALDLAFVDICLGGSVNNP